MVGSDRSNFRNARPGGTAYRPRPVVARRAPSIESITPASSSVHPLNPIQSAVQRTETLLTTAEQITTKELRSVGDHVRRMLTTAGYSWSRGEHDILLVPIARVIKQTKRRVRQGSGAVYSHIPAGLRTYLRLPTPVRRALEYIKVPSPIRRWQVSYFTMLFLAVLAVPFAIIISNDLRAQRYELSAATKQLVGEPVVALDKKVAYNSKTKTYQYNPGAINGIKSRAGGAGNGISIGGSDYYGVDLAKVAKQGQTFTDAQTKLSFSLVPQFGAIDGKREAGHIVYPSDKGQIVYTLKDNGLKEDVILTTPTDSTTLTYKLNLPSSLEARLNADGSVGIYSVDASLFGNITYGSDADQASIEKARTNGKKTNLVFLIPAPVITQTGKTATDQATYSTAAKAKFALNTQTNTLTVTATNLSKLNYPISIDPSVVVTSANGFGTGNNEDNNATIATGSVTRGSLSGGAVGSWGTAGGTTFTTSRMDHSVTVSSGYVYLIGGNSSVGGNFNSVQYAQITTSGTIGSWSTAGTSPNLPDNKDTSNTVQSYNGYIYVMAGTQGADPDSNNVWYAAVCTGTNTTVVFATNCTTSSTPGITSSWSAANTGAAFTGRLFTSSAVYNGYLYIIAGCPSTSGAGCSTTNSMTSDVSYAKINVDGTLSAWTSTTATFAGRYLQSSIASNGYLYVMGGCTAHTVATVNCSADASDVWYTPLSPTTGAPGTWVQTNSLTTATATGVASVSNGYIYLMGGCNSNTPTCNQQTPYTTIEYAPLYANGAVGSWSTTTALSAGRERAAGFAYAGWQFIIGGCTNNGLNCNGGGSSNDSVSAQINPVGNTGLFTTPGNYTGAGPGPARTGFATVAYGGYIYVTGGTTSNAGAKIQMLNTTLFAHVNSDGSLGTWNTSTNNFTDVSAGTGDYCSTGGNCPGRIDLTAGVYNGYFFIAGGWTNQSGPGSDTTWSDVQSALICTGTNNTGGCSGGSTPGDLGTWSIATADFGTSPNQTTTYNDTNGKAWPTMQIYNGYMYIIGGINSPTASPFATSTIRYAALNATGGISGNFASTTLSLPSARSGVHSFVDSGRLYIVGGGNGGGWAYQNSDTDDVKFVAICTALNTPVSGCTGAGDLAGSWTDANTASGGSGSSFATAGALNDYGVTVSNGIVYVSGGNNGFSGGTNTFNTVKRATFNANGTLSTWNTSTAFTTNRYQHGAVAVNGFFYIIGGCDSRAVLASTNCQGTMQTTYEAAPLNNGGGGSSGTWNTTNNLSYGSAAHGSIAYNGFLYEMGGCTAVACLLGTEFDNVRHTTINADGTIGASWTTDTVLPNSRAGFGLVAYAGRLYVIGGQQGGGGSQSTVYYATPSTSTGNITAWSTANSFNTGRVYLSAFAYNGYMYVLGGAQASANTACNTLSSTECSDVQYAPINSDGSLGTWQFTANSASTGSFSSGFTTGRQNLIALAHKGYAYIAGGWDGNTNVYSDVQYAPINSDGTIGSWATTTSLSNPRYTAIGVAYNGYFYAYNGLSSPSTGVPTVEYAPFNGNGSLGSWTISSTNITTNAATYTYGSGAIANGYIYYTGGQGGTFSSAVSYAPLQVIARTSHYSRLIDTASTTTVTTASTTSFSTPNLTYTVPAGNTVGSGTVTVSGCNQTADNGVFPVTSGTNTTIVVTNSAGVASATGCLIAWAGNNVEVTRYMMLDGSSLGAGNACLSFAPVVTFATPTCGFQQLLNNATSGQVTTGLARYIQAFMTIDDSQNATFPESSPSSINEFDLFFHPAPNRRMKGGKTTTNSSYSGTAQILNSANGLPVIQQLNTEGAP
jgi:hypothetical protein